ncbi:MAG: hypothetical protein VX201_09100, partial [Pseudomonadota bacterium]|nr:hypothetical protein [Pseudomonadota bacterium]
FKALPQALVSNDIVKKLSSSWQSDCTDDMEKITIALAADDGDVSPILDDTIHGFWSAARYSSVDMFFCTF